MTCPVVLGQTGFYLTVALALVAMASDLIASVFAVSHDPNIKVIEPFHHLDLSPVERLSYQPGTKSCVKRLSKAGSNFLTTKYHDGIANEQQAAVIRAN